MAYNIMTSGEMNCGKIADWRILHSPILARATYMRHQINQAHRPCLLQISEIAQRARSEEVCEVKGQFEEGIELARVLWTKVCCA